jgi:hypothetical protein
VSKSANTPTQVTGAVLQLSNEDLALIRSALQHYGLAKESEARIEQYAHEHNFLNANGLKPSQAVVIQRLDEAKRARQLMDWFESEEEATPTPKKANPGRLQDLYSDPIAQDRAQLIQEVCDFWCELVGLPKPRLDDTDFERYFTPAGLLLECVGFDLHWAKNLLTAKRQELIRQGVKGSSLTKLSAIVPRIVDNLD